MKNHKGYNKLGVTQHCCCQKKFVLHSDDDHHSVEIKFIVISKTGSIDYIYYVAVVCTIYQNIAEI